MNAICDKGSTTNNNSNKHGNVQQQQRVSWPNNQTKLFGYYKYKQTRNDATCQIPGPLDGAAMS